MGSGACKGVCVAVQDASDEEILQFFSAWPAAQRERVGGLLSSCSKGDAQKADDSVRELDESLSKLESSKGLGDTVPLDEKQIKQVHSAFRWGKSVAEIEEIMKDWGGPGMKDALAATDAQNGNRALHIAAQNGHMTLTKYILEQKADPSVQNFNGQTPLHMSVEYDMYFQSKLLLDAKADPNITNTGGHTALTGLEGTKTGLDAWDNPMNILKAAEDNEEEMKVAFEALEAADPKDLDRAILAQTGMRKRKQCPKHWQADRFKGIVQKL